MSIHVSLGGPPWVVCFTAHGVLLPPAFITVWMTPLAKWICTARCSSADCTALSWHWYVCVAPSPTRMWRPLTRLACAQAPNPDFRQSRALTERLSQLQREARIVDAKKAVTNLFIALKVGFRSPACHGLPSIPRACWHQKRAAIVKDVSTDMVRLNFDSMGYVDDSIQRGMSTRDVRGVRLSVRSRAFSH